MAGPLDVVCPRAQPLNIPRAMPYSRERDGARPWRERCPVRCKATPIECSMFRSWVGVRPVRVECIVHVLIAAKSQARSELRALLRG